MLQEPDISEKLKRDFKLSDAAFSQMLQNLCIALFAVDLKTLTLRVVSNDTYVYDIGKTYDYREYYATNFKGELEDRYDILAEITPEKLSAIEPGGVPKVMSCELKAYPESIVKLTIYRCPERQDLVYLVFSREHKASLLSAIAARFIYSNSDYFIYLDARRNTYVSFAINADSTTPPPVISNDYDRDIELYANAYVAPEERENTIYEMSLARVTEVLDEKGVHVFYTTVIENGERRRKRLEYRFYNKAERMILLYRSDVTDIYNENHRYAEELQAAVDRAYRDPLTRLFNYQGMGELCRERLEVQKLYSKALLSIDLDNFKNINDTFGHLKGDAVLEEVAKAISSCTRESDIAGRIGGDEFEILLDNVTSHQEAMQIARRILRKIEEIPQKHSLDVPLSCSIGIAFAPLDGRTYEELVKVCDERAYEAKHQGKHGIIAL